MQGIKGKQPVPHSNANVLSNTALKVLSSKPKFTRRFQYCPEKGCFVMFR